MALRQNARKARAARAPRLSHYKTRSLVWDAGFLH